MSLIPSQLTGTRFICQGLFAKKFSEVFYDSNIVAPTELDFWFIMGLWSAETPTHLKRYQEREMTTPFASFYRENIQETDWSLVNFAFEIDNTLLDDSGEIPSEIESMGELSIKELLEENERQVRLRTCSRCKKRLPLSSFEKGTRCIQCVKESPWGRKDTNSKRAAPSARVRDNGGWIAENIRRCRGRAKAKGVTFDMSAADLLDPRTGELPVFCPIFPHILLDYEVGIDRRKWASVDRIVPELGYTTGNVWVISFAANLWKNDGSNPAERKRIITIMQGKKPKPPKPDQPSLFDGL